jgi:ABC-type amino acid transport substrate-binding protein
MGIKHFKAYIFFICQLISPVLCSQQQVDPCQQVSIVGDTNWAPYAFMQDKSVYGVGIDLVDRVFKELDIPVKVLDYVEKRRIMHGLRLGDIGIIVTLYEQEDLKDIVDIIQPGYILDPITVATRRGKGENIKRWDDLIGQRGIVTKNFVFEDSFHSYSQRYLYIQPKGNLNSVLKDLAGRKADYLIGSKEQLLYGINKYELNEELELLPTVTVSSEVHMGFSKQSACYAYYPYLKQRLIEYRKAGVVRELMASYHNKLQEKVDLDLDFLFDEQEI